MIGVCLWKPSQTGTQQVKKAAIAEQNRKRDVESSRNVGAALLADRRRGAGAVTPPPSKVDIRAPPLCRRDGICGLMILVCMDIGRVFLWFLCIARTFWLGGLGHQALYRLSEALIHFGEHHLLLSLLYKLLISLGAHLSLSSLLVW